jgi:hypothetical protein
MDILNVLISPFGIPIVAIVCGCTVAMVATVAKQWRKAREAELEASLKAEMIKQGRSPEEIAKILRLSSKAHAPTDEA